MIWQHIAAEALFVSAGIFAVWVIVHSVREAWPHIKELLRDQDE